MTLSWKLAHIFTMNVIKNRRIALLEEHCRQIDLYQGVIEKADDKDIADHYTREIFNYLRLRLPKIIRDSEPMELGEGLERLKSKRDRLSDAYNGWFPKFN